MALTKQQKFIATALVVVATICTAVFFITKPFREMRDEPVEFTSGDTLEVLSTVPDFTLTDQNDKPISLSDLKGKIWLADLIFTRCEGICPVMSSNFEKLQSKVGADIKLVSFSVDPEYDSTAVLREYAERFSADQSKWTFVTGHRPTMFSLAKNGFLLGVDSTGLSPSELVTHSEKFVLIDQQGRMRAYYNGTDSTTHSKILRDIETLRRGS
jgi:protein SCO1